MDIIYNKIFLEHDTGEHPENRKRLEVCGSLPETEVENGEKYLTLFHTKEYIGKIKSICANTKDRVQLDPDTVVSPKSYEAAIYAVGAAVMASKTGSLALVRPPGHHSHPDHSSGFCIFNNIAIAAKRLVDEGKKVLIFDFDGHLGDGTMDFFYNTNKVMYFSIHQESVFPGGGEIDDIGVAEGLGYTINIPLPAESGDDAYLAVLEKFLPALIQFGPDIVAVSAGFDGHHNDILLNLRYSLNLYYQIGKKLKDNFADIFASLEGGYNLEFFPKCLFNFIDGVSGRPMTHKEDKTDSPILVLEEIEERSDRLRKNLEAFWKF